VGATALVALVSEQSDMQGQARHSWYVENVYSPGVVDEHTVHALLDGVEEAHRLAINVHDHGSVPAVCVLVVTARIKQKNVKERASRLIGCSDRL
jgi:hypothetical protein